jgi:tRNA(fMet)-specific endonuclease VapC
MTGNKCLLDTSVIIHTFRENNAVSVQLDAIGEIYVPLIVIGELFYGAYKSADPAKHITRMQFFLNNCIALHLLHLY